MKVHKDSDGWPSKDLDVWKWSDCPPKILERNRDRIRLFFVRFSIQPDLECWSVQLLTQPPQLFYYFHFKLTQARNCEKFKHAQIKVNPICTNLKVGSHASLNSGQRLIQNLHGIYREDHELEEAKFWRKASAHKNSSC